jgi:purine nucleosidase
MGCNQRAVWARATKAVDLDRRCHMTERIPLLLDTDIGSDIDDAICLAYLLAHPRCDLRGVTTVSGMPRVRAALADAVCRAAGRTDVAIHAGTEHAILGPTPQPEVPQAVVLDRYDHRDADEFAPSTAVTFLRDAIASAPGEITLLSIGPMTNVALLLVTYPEVVPLLRSLMIMGGAYSMLPFAGGAQEWNVFCDPAAARVVYCAPISQHRSVGINASSRCTMPSTEVLHRFRSIGGGLGVVAAAIDQVWAQQEEYVTFHDPLAAVCIFEPDVCTWRGGRVSVELASRRFRGATSFDADRDGSPHQVADRVDVDRFLAQLFAVWP